MDSVDSARDSLCYSVELSGTASTSGIAPFWLTTGQNGRVSAAQYSGAMGVALYKKATRPARWFDYDFAIDLSARVHSPWQGNPKAAQLRRFPYIQTNQADFLVNQLYAHARLYVIDITAGVAPLSCNPELDPELTSGDLLFSQNSPAMPRISIGIDHYTAVPGLFGYMELRAGLTHAWLTDNVYTKGSFLHYKFIGGRFGGKLPVNVSYEFHHSAQWGGTSPEFGELGSGWDAFRHVFMAKAGGELYNEKYNSLGNHLGSQILTLTAKGNQWRVSAYWQNFFEDNVTIIGRGQNLPDGLWGIRAEQSVWPFISGITVEYLNTTDQSGPFHDQDGLIYAGNDDYYANSIYRSGWTYFMHTIGTPFIASTFYNSDGAISVHNSRAAVGHIGVKGDIFGFRYKAKCSCARNYYNYHSKGDIYRQEYHNTAWMLEISKHVPQAWGMDFSLRLAGDVGSQFGNTFGAMLCIAKRGLIKEY